HPGGCRHRKTALPPLRQGGLPRPVIDQSCTSKEELVREPTDAVQRIAVALVPQLRPLTDAGIPSFGELRQTDHRFFRRGRTDTYRDELPEELHQLFWSQPDNLAAMQLLGYGATIQDS